MLASGLSGVTGIPPSRPEWTVEGAAAVEDAEVTGEPAGSLRGTDRRRPSSADLKVVLEGIRPGQDWTTREPQGYRSHADNAVALVVLWPARSGAVVLSELGRLTKMV
jgi:hypothetical protein